MRRYWLIMIRRIIILVAKWFRIKLPPARLLYGMPIYARPVAVCLFLILSRPTRRQRE
jgi:hypothetical protein